MRHYQNRLGAPKQRFKPIGKCTRYFDNIVVMTRTVFGQLGSNDQLIYETLLSYSKTSLNENERARLEAALPAIENTELFVERAVACHLAPLMHKALASVEHSVPTKVTNAFASAYNQVLMRNVRMYQVFESILLDLNRANIDCVPLKGIYLAEAVYKDVGLRHLSDIDLLVHERDVNSVCELMRSNGWGVTVAEMRSEFEKNQFSPAHPYSFFKDGIVIELHVRLFNLNLGMQLNEEALWAHTREESLAKGLIRQLDTEMLLMYLCMHLHKHLLSWEAKMVSFCDIRELLIQRKDDFNWDECHRLCIENKCLSQVSEVLDICQKHWSVQVPPSLFERAKMNQQTEERFWQFLTGNAAERSQVAENVVGRSWRHMQSLKSFRAKLSYLLGYAFPRPVFMYRQYRLAEGAFLLPWYFLRLLALGKKLVLALLNIVKRAF